MSNIQILLHPKTRGLFAREDGQVRLTKETSRDESFVVEPVQCSGGKKHTAEAFTSPASCEYLWLSRMHAPSRKRWTFKILGVYTVRTTTARTLQLRCLGAATACFFLPSSLVLHVSFMRRHSCLKVQIQVLRCSCMGCVSLAGPSSSLATHDLQETQNKSG